MVLNDMMRRGMLAVTALGFIGLTQLPAMAQEATAEHLAAARAALDAIDSTEQFDNILMNAATQIKADLIGNNPDMQSAISNMVDDRALALAPRRSDLEDEVARVYARLFTQAELSEIAAFYSSGAGQKLLAQGPLATREMLVAADIWSNGIVRDLRASAAEGMTEMLPQATGAVAPVTAPEPGDAGAATAPAAGAASTQ